MVIQRFMGLMEESAQKTLHTRGHHCLAVVDSFRHTYLFCNNSTGNCIGYSRNSIRFALLESQPELRPMLQLQKPTLLIRWLFYFAPSRLMCSYIYHGSSKSHIVRCQQYSYWNVLVGPNHVCHMMDGKALVRSNK
jgi:hypothetical protein